jgi:hypothetical protein
MLNKITLFSILLTLFACQKETESDILYEVDCNGTCIVDYAENGGITQTETVTGNWTKQWKGKAGQQFYLKVELDAEGGDFDASVKIDGETFHTVSSSTVEQSETISGIIPD